MNEKVDIIVIMNKELEKQINIIFGIDLEIEPYDKKTGLPRYLTSGRRIFIAKSSDVDFYIVKIHEPKDSRVLSKEIGEYESALGGNVAFWFESLNKNYRNSFVKHHIPFVMIPTQIFLPFLGILFTKKFTNTNGVARTKLSYNAQMLLIKLLYLPRIKYSKADIAQRLQLNPVYVTRATKELLDMGLISEYKEGRSVFVERENSSEELFDSAKQLFVSPISKVIYVKKNKRLQEYPIASDYALSEISMINPSDVPVYACWKKDELVNDVKIIDEPSWNDSDDMVKLELWDYDPKKLSDGKTVDIVSLYCSLMNNNDPRIQKEMEDILEDFEWQL